MNFTSKVIVTSVTAFILCSGIGAVNGMSKNLTLTKRPFEESPGSKLSQTVYADDIESSFINSNYSTAEELLQEQQKQAETINHLSIILDYLENTNQSKSEEAELMRVYVENLKVGKISVNVDHIISNQIDKAIAKGTEKYPQVPQAITRGVMKQESNFNPTIVSKSGAQGLMQLMPDTAKGLHVKNVWDIEQNVLGGVQFLDYLMTKYKGNYRNVLAAYNAGPGAVDSWLKDKRYSNDGETLKNIPYAETKHYVEVVLKNYNSYK